jgi:HCOMODA/2-hydroxy-3-carboxy-muconic semialdehyde decarboxylase
MRGHGATTTAPSIELAVYLAIYAEINAKLQISAAALGSVTFLNAEEAALVAAAAEDQVDRAWQLWAGRIAAF